MPRQSLRNCFALAGSVELSWTSRCETQRLVLSAAHASRRASALKGPSALFVGNLSTLTMLHFYRRPRLSSRLDGTRWRCFSSRVNLCSLAILVATLLLMDLVTDLYTNVLKQRLRVDRSNVCPTSAMRDNASTQDSRAYAIFIGAGTREYIAAALHLAASLSVRSARLVQHSLGITILTSTISVKDCEDAVKVAVNVTCAAVTPEFQQRGSHAEVYNKFEVWKHTPEAEWLIYLDADTIVLDELYGLMRHIPDNYELMAVKDYPSVLLRLKRSQASWGLNGGILILNKRILSEYRADIAAQMKDGLNDQIIWSNIFYKLDEKNRACLLGEEFNCRPNTHRGCHRRAKVIHYSSSSKHALYYFKSAAE